MDDVVTIITCVVLGAHHAAACLVVKRDTPYSLPTPCSSLLLAGLHLPPTQLSTHSAVTNTYALLSTGVLLYIHQHLPTTKHWGTLLNGDQERAHSGSNSSAVGCGKMYGGEKGPVLISYPRSQNHLPSLHTGCRHQHDLRVGRHGLEAHHAAACFVAKQDTPYPMPTPRSSLLQAGLHLPPTQYLLSNHHHPHQQLRTWVLSTHPTPLSMDD